MASSQVEIVLSSPFGCVLRNHNRRDRCRESNALATQDAFQENLRNFVRDHLNTCNSISSESATEENTHHEININEADSWISNRAKNNLGSLRFKGRNQNNKEKDESSSLESPRQSQILDRWAARKAREMVSTIETEAELLALPNLENFPSSPSSYISKRGVSPTPSDSSSEISNLGASSLVQIWEKRLNQSNDSKSNPITSPRSSSPRLQPEHRTFPQVTSSPRIRGRRALTDLLMQIERDRYGELNNLAERGAVSKFTQRGRIQSLLRLRLLKRGLEASDQCCRQQSAKSEVNREPQGSTVMHLRERFRILVEQETTAQAEAANPRKPLTDIVNNSTQVDNYANPTQFSKDTHSQTVHGTGNHHEASTQKSEPQTSNKDHNVEAHPSSNVSFQGCFETENVDSQEIAKITPSMADSNANEMEHEVEAKQYYTAETSYDQTIQEEDSSDQQYAENSYDDVAEDVEGIEQQYDETYYDWIGHISRPRSYWEDRRQRWYKEMLDTGSDKEEIRQLLERRTVSTFLSSDFRERMDKLMESHIGTQTHLVGSQDDEEENRGRMDQLTAFLQEHLRPAGNPEEDRGERVEKEDRRQEEEEEEEDEEKAEEEASLISGSYQGVNDYFIRSSPSVHMPSPSPLSTWSYRDNEASDDSDRIESTSSSEPSRSQSFYQDSQRYPSSTNHHSIEMELIYDLRGHMEQLYQEMSELRKSIKSCTDMQMDLQQSMNQEVHTVKEEKKSQDKAPKKGHCCICYESKIDSLLYRCGHMCACLKCANELQWNSGKCPICRAPIVDVVRVYVDA